MANLDDLKRLRAEAMAAGTGTGRWIKAATALMDAFPAIYDTAKALNTRQAELAMSLQALKPGAEVIQWRDVDPLPGANAPVLIELLGDGESSWLGAWDGEQWRYINGDIVSCTVTGWATIPSGRPHR